VVINRWVMGTKLELHIKREGTKFNVEADSPFGERSGFFELDPSLLSGIHEIQEAINERRLLDEPFVIEFGIKLFELLFSDIKNLFHECLDKSDHLNIILNMKDPNLNAIPWELCYDPDRHLFLGAHPRVSLARRDQKTDTKFGEIDYPLKVLVIISSPMDLGEKGDYQPDPDEIEALMAPLTPLVEKGMITIDFLERASVKCIQDQLKKGYHIVHFVGHGSYKDGKGHLIIEDKARNSKWLSQEEVAHLFGTHPPQLLFLTACESLPLVPFVLSERVPAVLGMQFSILVEISHYFLERFYSLLLQGDSVLQAVSNARNAVRLEEGTGSTGWFTPVLYVRSEDILKMNTESGLTPPEKKGEGFNMVKDLIGAENFVGRRRDLWLIEKALFEDRLKVIVVRGIGGIGKTALASKFVKRHKNEFKAVFAKKMVDPHMGVEEILGLLDQFFMRNGDDGLHAVLQESVDLKLEVLNRCLKKGYLIVLDNFEILIEDSRIRNEDIEKFLQAVMSGDHLSKVVITSRYGFTFRDEKGLVKTVDLDELRPQFALQLLEKLGIEDFEMRVKIYSKIGGNPQFLEFFVRLAESRRVEDLLEDVTPVRAKIGDWLLNGLVELLSEEELKVLKGVSVFRLPVEKSAFDYVNASDSVVEKLVYYSLVKFDQYYFMHPGVKDYVNSLLSDDERIEAHVEAVEYYRTLLEKKKADVLDVLELHYHLVESEQYEEAGGIVLEIFEVFYRWGFRGKLMELLIQTVKTTDGRTKAAALHDLGIILGAFGEYKEAEKYYKESLELAESLGDKQGIARSLHQLGNLECLQGSYKEAEKYYKKSLELLESLGDKHGIASSLHQLGVLQEYQGNYKEAEKYYKESLELKESLGDKHGIASSLHQLGVLQEYQGNYKEAEKYYKESLELEESLGDKQGIAQSLHQLGILQQYQGNYKEAEKYYKESLELKESLGDKHGIAVSLHQLGMLQEYQGNYKEAEKYYKESLELAENLGDKHGIAASLYQLGRIHEEQEHYEKAVKYYTESLPIALQLQVPQTEMVIKSLQRVRKAMGKAHFEHCWKALTHQEVPDYITPYKELEDFIQYILYVIDNNEHDEIERATDTITELLKESEPDETQFLRVLLDYINRKDISKRIKKLKEPYKSLLEEYLE